MMISDIAAGYVAIRWGFQGPNYATTSACATSAHSLADALMILQRGDADIMLAGGTEAPNLQDGNWRIQFYESIINIKRSTRESISTI